MPVLSKAMALSRPAKLDEGAALDQHAGPRGGASAATMLTGVEITSAHGQAMTSSTSAR